MEDEEARRGASGTRRQRTDYSRRRPHSQPERLLSVSCRKSSDPSKDAPVGKPPPEGEKVVRVFKRRESSTRANTAAAAAAAPAADEEPKIKPAVAKSSGTTARTNAATEKWAPKLKNKQPPEPESRKRRQRMILEGSDDEECEPTKNNVEKESPKREEPKPAVVEGLRKSSRVVKRRTFDDEIDFEDVIRRRKKPEEKTEKVKQAEPPWAEENTDSAEDEVPRKKPRRGSIQELQKEKEKPAAKQRATPPAPGAAAVQESATPKEKSRSARQRSMQVKEASVQEQPSPTAVKDEPPKAESPGDSFESKEKTATPLTARQRSLQACKEGDGSFGLIEFPDGLNGTDRRRKAKLTDEEKLAKKAEAASKRKQQVEKAAKEIQASAIQKILNQDSNRKKREEKIQKQKQELAEERKAAELETATNSIRWTMGPSGTTVSWAQDVQMPTLFSGPISYPPPREKCAACDNAYKYRDSKSNLPLCSLQCYKAIQEPKATEVH